MGQARVKSQGLEGPILSTGKGSSDNCVGSLITPQCCAHGKLSSGIMRHDAAVT